MESILSLSFLGSLLLILTTLRLSKLIGAARNAGKVRDFFSLLSYQLDIWLRSAWKPFTILIITGLILSACYAATGDRYLDVWQTAMIFGTGSVGLGVLMTTLVADVQRMLHISLSLEEDRTYPLTAGKALVTVRNLLICLLCVLLVLLKQPYHTWGLFPTVSLLAGFAMGSATALVIAYLHRPKPRLVPETADWISRLLKPHRLDTLAGAIAATMLLGAGLSETTAIAFPSWASGPVMLPLLLAVNGVLISSITALLSGSHFYQFLLSYRSLPQKLLNALLMSGFSLILIKYMLASHWVLNGREYSSLHIFYTVLAGIVCGVVFHEMGRFYSYFRDRYHAYSKMFYSRELLLFRIMRLAFRTLYLLVPPVLAAVFLMIAFKYAGLYGIMLASVAMLSNLTTRFGQAFRT